MLLKHFLICPFLCSDVFFNIAMHSLSEQFDEVLNLVKSAKRILLATHEDPDGDGLGSLIAFALWLKDTAVAKEIVAFIKGDLPDYLSLLRGIEMCVRELPEREFDLLIGFDYADFKRLGLSEWFARQPRINIVTFDHHPGGRYQGDILLVDTAASSSTLVVYRFLNHIGASISPDIATCILSGIVTDTGGFVHSNTNTEAFMVAAEMMRRGADFSRITREVFRKKDPKYLRLWGEALFGTHFDKESGLVVSRVTSNDLKKHGAEKEAMVEFSSVLGTVEGSRCSVFLNQDSDDADYIRGSLRSEEYKNFDVSRLAAAFGGGGHKLASGFRIKGNWRGVVEKLVSEAYRMNHES